jgi:hypothetical protein
MDTIYSSFKTILILIIFILFQVSLMDEHDRLLQTTTTDGGKVVDDVGTNGNKQQQQQHRLYCYEKTVV